MGTATFPGADGPAASSARVDEAARLGFGPTLEEPTPLDVPGPAGRGGRRAVAAVAVSLVVLAGGFLGYRLLADGSPELPGELAGTPRMQGPQVEIGVQAFRSELEAGGMEGDMAFYGQGGIPSFVVAWFHDPSRTPLDSAFQRFSMGFAGASPTGLDPGSVEARTVDGVRYVCASGSQMAAGICMWADGDTYWVVLDVRAGAAAVASRDLAVRIHAET